MRHAFHHWEQITGRLRSGGTIALFLDFDGTLARLQPRPEGVSMDGGVRWELIALARSPRFRVWVISGRRQADVQGRIRIPGIRYLGLHGWEGRGRVLSETTSCCLRALRPRLDACLAQIPGLWIEDKEYAIAIHYGRAAKTDALRARKILDRILQQTCSDLFRIQDGKNIWEILPRELADKGAAVQQELALLRGRPIAVYLGDDQVDEPAFATLRGGVTVRVGKPERSRALYRLGGIADVRTFLHRLRAEFA